MNTIIPKKPIPDVLLHAKFFIGGLLGFLVIFLLARFTKFPYPVLLQVVIGIPSWLAVVIPVFGYLVVYPFIHLLNRYEGSSQQTWMIWLVLDTVGPTFGLVRVWYYLSQIIPDFRNNCCKS